jgi:hypothetical protein
MPQAAQMNCRPFGLVTFFAHRGKVELVPRSSTSSTLMPARAALSESAAIAAPGRQLATAKFCRLPALT